MASRTAKRKELELAKRRLVETVRKGQIQFVNERLDRVHKLKTELGMK